MTALSGAAVLLAGCASTPPAPTAQIEAARQAINDAERAQAAQHAAPELGQARSKIAAAEAAVQNEDMDDAARLAEEARVDAELADARTAAVKAKMANDEIRRANSAVLDEMQRTTTGGTQ
ncbi:MAG TPA: DUF4398 domain-containing protein [Steroidobacteraceae bacterium]|nr:DUF4398 domain-containing protein [Steroidobacteraceae bacterium]